MSQVKVNIVDGIKKSIVELLNKRNWNKTLKSQSPEHIFQKFIIKMRGEVNNQYQAKDQITTKLEQSFN
jgi:glutathione peroxidase-family protein